MHSHTSYLERFYGIEIMRYKFILAAYGLAELVSAGSRPKADYQGSGLQGKPRSRGDPIANYNPQYELPARPERIKLQRRGQCLGKACSSPGSQDSRRERSRRRGPLPSIDASIPVPGTPVDGSQVSSSVVNAAGASSGNPPGQRIPKTARISGDQPLLNTAVAPFDPGLAELGTLPRARSSSRFPVPPAPVPDAHAQARTNTGLATLQIGNKARMLPPIDIRHNQAGRLQIYRSDIAKAYAKTHAMANAELKATGARVKANVRTSASGRGHIAKVNQSGLMIESHPVGPSDYKEYNAEEAGPGKRTTVRTMIQGDAASAVQGSNIPWPQKRSLIEMEFGVNGLMLDWDS